MNIKEIAKEYHTDLDAIDKSMIDKNVAEKGIGNYLSQQLIYLDCSRVLQGMRMMQTIGYPYQREVSSYLYAVEMHAVHKHIWEEKLLERHQANLEYEKENPPVWYDGKPKKSNKRKPKAKEGDMFPEETKKAKISKAEAKLKAKLLGASIGFGSFKFKKD